MQKCNMIGEHKRPADIHAPIFSMKPGGKPTGMKSKNNGISNGPVCLWRSSKTKYPLDLPSPTGTKIFKYNCNVH